MNKKLLLIIVFLLSICIIITSCKKEEPVLEETKVVYNIPKVSNNDKESHNQWKDDFCEQGTTLENQEQEW